jgi:hypothetical protein
MIKYGIIIISILFSFSNLYAQTIDNVKVKSSIQKFKDKKNGLWGIIDKKNDSIICKPQFKRINHSWEDTVFHVTTINDFQTLISINGENIVPFDNQGIYDIIINDSTNMGHLAYVSNYVGSKYNYRMILISNKNECIPKSYYPCPYTCKLVDDSISFDLRLIQNAEKSRYMNDIDSAIFYCNKAIVYDPTNASLYYWGAELLLDNGQENIKYKNNLIFKKYYDWIEECLNKASEMEYRTLYRGKILRLQYYFYKHNRRNKEKVKKIKSELESLRQRMKEKNLWVSF